jgi:hypothetical protein
MAFQISPGVNVSEVDLTTVVPSILTTAGAFAGTFSWGPANIITQIDSEIGLVNTFGQPDSNSAISFFTAANYLAYGNNLKIVRALGTLAKNSTDSVAIKIANKDVYESTYLNQNNSGTYGAFAARCAGALGNSLTVSTCDNSTDYATWTYKSYFPGAPGNSEYVTAVGGQDDELHIVVVDRLGLFSAAANTVLETYAYVSKARDASINGVSNYYKQVVFNNSKYVYVMDPPDYAGQSGTWGGLSTTNFTSLSGVSTVNLAGGVDAAIVAANTTSAFGQFLNKDTVDVSLIITGDASATVQNYVISSIAATRKDCVAFVSPPSSSVVNQSGSEVTNIATWLSSVATTSTYAVADSGWKYQYDKYNNVYRYIPLNGDVAGLCVNTDTVRDPWYSPAGFSRGQIKNAIKLAWNPSKTDRDTIYASGVNPVVSFPGQGIVLFGDKTLTTRPSAFDRINVRRLFITLEKSIAEAAKFSLFEQNDEFTRAQFVATVTPFLRDVKGRRGITDFKVVCDTTNNTSNVIDSNQFVGDIYIKPSRSVNYIQLNFVAVGTGVDFNTIVGV